MPADKIDIQTRDDTSSGGFHPMDTLRHEVENAFHRISARVKEVEPLKRLRDLVHRPTTDATRSDAQYRLSFELPGLTSDDIELYIDRDLLVLQAEKSSDEQHASGEYVIQERHWGRFERSFSLPSDVDREHIDAEFKNGVLNVTLPRRADAQSNKHAISIKSH